MFELGFAEFFWAPSFPIFCSSQKLDKAISYFRVLVRWAKLRSKPSVLKFFFNFCICNFFIHTVNSSFLQPMLPENIFYSFLGEISYSFLSNYILFFSLQQTSSFLVQRIKNSSEKSVRYGITIVTQRRHSKYPKLHSLSAVVGI